MELKRFALGIRFDLLTEPLTPQTQREIWQEIFSVLTLSDVKGLQLFAGPSLHTVSGQENVYLCVLSGGKLKQMRRIFTKLDKDAGIGIRLAAQHPFIQNNRLLLEEHVECLGSVVRDGSLCGGLGLPSDVRIPKKHGKRRPEGRGIKVMLIPEAIGEELPSHEVVKYFTSAARKHFMGVEVRPVPITDGGRDTVDAVITATGALHRETQLVGANRQKYACGYAVLNGRKAVMSLASTLQPEERGVAISSDPAGQLLRRLLDEGLEEITIAAQDYCAMDFGVGFVRALGVRFYNEEGEDLKGFSTSIGRIDAEYLHPAVQRTRIRVLCQEPLTFEQFLRHAPCDLTQQQAEEFARGGEHLREVLTQSETSAPNEAFEGVAGGLGLLMEGLLRAQFEPSVQAFLDVVNIKKLLKGVSLVVTAVPKLSSACFVEGLLLPRLIAECGKKKIPIALLAGEGEAPFALPSQWKNIAVMPIPHLHAASLAQRREATDQAADRMFQFLRAGAQIPKRSIKKRCAMDIDSLSDGGMTWNE